MTAFGSVVRHASNDLPPPPVALPPRAALFLDLDGTLAPIMPRPEQVGPTHAARRCSTICRERWTAGWPSSAAVRWKTSTASWKSGVKFVAAVHGLVRRGVHGVDRASAASRPGPRPRRAARPGAERQGPVVRGQDPQRRLALSQRALGRRCGDREPPSAWRKARSWCCNWATWWSSCARRARTRASRSRPSCASGPSMGAVAGVRRRRPDRRGRLRRRRRLGGYGVLVGPDASHGGDLSPERLQRRARLAGARRWKLAAA
jgi:hypothetical protein